MLNIHALQAADVAPFLSSPRFVSLRRTETPAGDVFSVSYRDSHDRIKRTRKVSFWEFAVRLAMQETEHLD